MARERSLELPSFPILCVGLVVVGFTFGVPFDYGRGGRIILAGVQLAVLMALVWAAGMRRMSSSQNGGRKIIAAAILLMWPQVTFALMPGFGPPDFADAGINAIRFSVLLADVIAIGAGSFMLADVLQEAGETYWSRLAFGVMISATPVYLIWGTMLLSSYRMAAEGTPWHLGTAERGPVQNVIDILQFFGGFLTYLAGLLFALSMNLARLSGRKAASILVAVELFALVCMLVRGIDNPPLTLLPSEIFAIIGWAAGIPAVPWMALCVIGLLLLRVPNTQVLAKSEPTHA